MPARVSLRLIDRSTREMRLSELSSELVLAAVLFALPARRVLMLRAALLHVDGWPVRIQTRLRPIRSAEHD